MSTTHSSDDLLLRLESLVRSVRRRRTLRLLLRGLLATGGLALVVFVASSWAMDQMLYTERAVFLIRMFAWITVAAFALRSLVLPFLRKTTDRQIAFYIEEHEPELEAALITSLEVGAADRRDGGVHSALHRRLLADTIERCERIDFGRGIERSSLQRAAGGLAGVAAVALLLALLSPAFLRHGASLLLFPWASAAVDNPYGIEVSPRDGVFARGADIHIVARLVGFTDDEVRLVRRVGDETEWRRESMVPTGDEGDGDAGAVSASGARFETLILAADRSFQYYVEAAGIRSPVMDVEVIELPYTERIDLTYRFPEYSGLESELVEDGGDVAALEGTEVELRVTPTMPTEGVRFVVEERDPVDLERGGDGAWQTRFVVDEPGFYHLEMLDARGRWGRASADYGIRILDDEPPTVTVREPGRDLRVNKIEEIFIEASARDDYGIRKVELFWSVNGGEPRSRVLTTAGRTDPQQEVIASHTFFLEDYELQDGDFLSYYVSAEDGRPGAGSRTRSSDIYFLEVRPFSQEYRRADGGGGGGGGGGAEAELSKRQREIVAATFRLQRDRPTFSDKEFEESVATVSLSQSRLREQVQTLMTRMGNRATLMGEDDFMSILGHLESALEPMQRAIDELGERDLDTALQGEQEALAALQRAEAMFRDVRVSFDPGGGGGGGGGSLAEDLADLFELELDKLRNQYETVQRGNQQQADQQVDEVEERLRELAQRQQRENERRRRLGQQSAGGGGGAQEQLIEETEELARRLERLAREQASPDLRQTAQQLRDAVDSMKRSGSEGEARRGSAGASAAEALEEARRLLDKTRRTSVEEGITEARGRAAGVARRQSEIRQEVEEMAGAGAGTGAGANREQMQQLLQRKEQLERDVANLEDELDRLARQARSEQPELSRGLQEAANQLRTTGVGKKIEYSRSVLTGEDAELAARFERSIEQDLEQLAENVEAAAAAAGSAEGQAADDSLEEARQLVQGLESLERRLRDRQQQAGGQGEETAAGSEGGQRMGEQGPGSRPGEGEQEGQSGQGDQGQEGSSESRAGTAEGEGREGSAGEDGAAPSAGQGGRPAENVGEQGAAPGPGQGRQAGRGVPTMGSGSAAGSLQPGAFTEEDLRQLDREVAQRLRQTEELRQALEEQGFDTADLRDIERQMARMDTRQLTNDPLALESLRRNIEELRQFEFTLWRSLGGDETLVRSPRAEEAPEGYEEQAERYFRVLAGEREDG